uniref:Uncharacterized protein n=1 Tax=Siphoviridae sp. ctR0j7 TaxID=2823580 RepID=A0A8S5LHD8_9CAUD|nr:MAG TPA: hypothetical protein [Siphoviridae sp. ctR0j7]
MANAQQRCHFLLRFIVQILFQSFHFGISINNAYILNEKNNPLNSY